MTSFRCNEDVTQQESEDVVELQAQISKLFAENEKYKQELYELHRKIETNTTMQSELVEINEALEQSLKEHQATVNQKIHEVEDKHLQHKKLLEERLEEMETELNRKSKENQDLKEIIKINDEKLLALNQVEISVCTEENTDVLKCEIERLVELLKQETDMRKHCEDTTEMLQSELNEFKEILAGTKEQLVEKNRILESTKEELSYCRMELESLKTTPATDTFKGNSLFSEVEDRRKVTLERMTAMHNRYQEAKRSFQAKEAEIKALKAERAMLLRKWEDDTVDKIQQDESLCQMYKNRIADLEKQLKDEQKKQKQTAKSQQASDNNFSFLQSLVDTKQREVEELRAKVERDSIKALLDEETKHKIGKQLRYWRYRAMSTEAQFLSIKTRLESDPSTSNIELLTTVQTCLNAKQSESLPDEENSINIEASYRETTIADQTVVSLESLMTIPKTICSDSMDATSTNAEDMDETTCITSLSSPVMRENNEDTVKSACSVKREHQKPHGSTENAIAIKFASENESEKENSDCKVSAAPILKSVLSNSKAQQNLGAKTTIKETNEKDRKMLRFTEDTIDPPSKPLKKQSSAKPQYPIIFISCNKSKV